MVGTIASPSNPSVRLTALLLPTITNMPTSGKAKPNGISTSLNTGIVSPVPSGPRVSHVIADGAGKAHAELPQHLRARRHALGVPPRQFEEVVGKADPAIAERQQQHRPHVAVAQVGP